MEQMRGESRAEFLKRRREANQREKEADLAKIHELGEVARRNIVTSREVIQEEGQALHSDITKNAEKLDEVAKLHKKMLDI